MPVNHTIAEGEGVTMLADRHGLDAQTVWWVPANEQLRALRGDKDLLYPGNQLVLLDKVQHVEPCITDRRHVFRRRGVPARYRVQILDGSKPVAGASYSLGVDGTPHNGSTGGNGILQKVDPAAKQVGYAAGADAGRPA
jgi:hypothetical protein